MSTVFRDKILLMPYALIGLFSLIIGHPKHSKHFFAYFEY